MYAYQHPPYQNHPPGGYYTTHPPPHPHLSSIAVPPPGKPSPYKAFPSPATSGDSPTKLPTRTHNSARPSTAGSGATRDRSLGEGEGEGEDDLSGSDDGERAKLEIRREKNRVKQRNLRLRRANHIADLESALSQAQDEHTNAKALLASAERRGAQLEEWVRALEAVLCQNGFTSDVETLRLRHLWADPADQPPTKKSKRKGRDSLATLAQAASASASANVTPAAVPYTAIPPRPIPRPSPLAAQRFEHLPPPPPPPHMVPMPMQVTPEPGLAGREIPSSQFRQAEMEKKRKRDIDGPLLPPQYWDRGNEPYPMPAFQMAAQLDANAGSPSALRIENLLSPQAPQDAESINRDWAVPPPLMPAPRAWEKPPGPTDIIPFHPVDYPLPSPSPPENGLAFVPPHSSVLTARMLLLQLFPQPLPFPLPTLPSMAPGHQQIILIALSHLSPAHVTAKFKAQQFRDLSPGRCKAILQYESSPFPDPRLVLFPVVVLRAKMIQLVQEDPTFDLTAFIDAFLQSALVFGDPSDPDAWEMPDQFWDLWGHYVPLARRYCDSLKPARRRLGHYGATVGEMLLNLEDDFARRKDGKEVGKPPGWSWEKLLPEQV